MEDTFSFDCHDTLPYKMWIDHAPRLETAATGAKVSCTLGSTALVLCVTTCARTPTQLRNTTHWMHLASDCALQDRALMKPESLLRRAGQRHAQSLKSATRSCALLVHDFPMQVNEFGPPPISSKTQDELSKEFTVKPSVDPVKQKRTTLGGSPLLAHVSTPTWLQDDRRRGTSTRAKDVTTVA